MLTEEIELKIHMYFNVILVNCVCAHMCVCVKASTDLILEAAFGSDDAVFWQLSADIKAHQTVREKDGRNKSSNYVHLCH